jgi:hypothetical protein
MGGRGLVDGGRGLPRANERGNDTRNESGGGGTRYFPGKRLFADGYLPASNSGEIGAHS